MSPIEQSGAMMYSNFLEQKVNPATSVNGDKTELKKSGFLSCFNICQVTAIFIRPFEI